MRDFFNSWKFKVLVCVLALLIGILLYGGIASASETGSSFFGRMFAPIQRFSSNLSRKVEASLDMLLNADQYYEDNQKLKEQLGELYNQIIDYDKLKEENEQLRRVIGLKEDYPDYEFSPRALLSEERRTTRTVRLSSTAELTTESPHTIRLLPKRVLLALFQRFQKHIQGLRRFFLPTFRSGFTA